MLWVIALLLECVSLAALLFCLLKAPAWWALAVLVICHMAAAGTYFIPGRMKRDAGQEWERYEYHVYGWFVLFLPYLGMVGCLAVALARRVIMQEDALSQYKEFTKRERFRDLNLKPVKDVRVNVSEALDIEPIQDILRGSDTALKTGAIQLLARKGRFPNTIWMLQQCLTDEAEEVRYLAHLALLYIEEEYMERIQSIQDRTGEADASARLAAFKDLGKIYREYAASGLMDAETRQYYYEQALKAFSSAGQIDAQDVEVSCSVGEILMESRDYDAATRHFRMALNDERFALAAWLGIWQCCFEKRDMDTLAAAIEEARPFTSLTSDDPQRMHLFKFWINPEEVIDEI